MYAQVSLGTYGAAPLLRCKKSRRIWPIWQEHSEIPGDPLAQTLALLTWAQGALECRRAREKTTETRMKFCPASASKKMSACAAVEFATLVSLRKDYPYVSAEKQSPMW